MLNNMKKIFSYFNKRQSGSAKNMQSGFTLVELMVSLMIFIVVVLAAVGSLYSVNTASRKVQSMRSVLDNLTFAVESISRTVRTSSSLVCGGSANISGSPNCPFSDQADNTMLLVASNLGIKQSVEYRLGVHSNGNGSIQKRICEILNPSDPNSACFWTDWFSLTAPEININKLSFYVDGAESTDGKQSSVQLFVGGEAIAGGEVSPFAVQTFISQRATE
jgi:type II secretory pathway pseudopilin PulG